MPGRSVGPSRTVGPVTAIVVLVSAACASPPPTEPKTIVIRDDGESAADALRFMPLEDGTVFAYDTKSDSGDHGLLVMEVQKLRKDRFDLRVGSRTERLELVGGGVAFIEGGFLLKPPFASGATWKSRSGTVRVTGVDVAVDVPAGKFQGCLRTVEQTRETNGRAKAVTAFYCPHVGLARMEVEGDTPSGLAHETAVLRSFGPRVEVTRERDKTTTTTTTDVAEPSPRAQ